MKIVNNYDGSSIEILKNEEEKNIVILSPIKENSKFSNYYNFIIKNDKNEKGIVILKNLNGLSYEKSINELIPLFKNKKGLYEKINEKRINIQDNNLEIEILENEEIEISSYPRYTQYNLDKFLNEIKLDIKDNNRVVKELIIGDNTQKTIVIIGRQHPGETLSSYFIEGIISYIIENKEKLKDTCFLIFPIVNKNGVKNGNHRYYNGYDYNRMWNTNGILEEIDYIKKELSNYNIKLFIDVHCDEITQKDYIRFNDKNIVDNIEVISDPSKLNRFVRALIKQRKIISFKDKTAREYIKDKYKCDSMLVELSLSSNNEEKSKNQGKEFIKEILNKR